MELVKCTHCEYEHLYSIGLYLYGNSLHFPIYPKVKKGYCLNCNEFVDVQEGLEIDYVMKEFERCNNELSTIEKKWFKNKNDSNKILQLKSNYSDYISLIKNLDFRSSISSCIKCGHSNIVYKDIDKFTWVCPKCGIGRLYKCTEESDVIFRIKPKIIKPVVDGKRFRLGYWIFKCCYDLLYSELYILNKESTNYIPPSSLIELITERFSFVFGWLAVYKNDLISSNILKTIRDLYSICDYSIYLSEIDFGNRILKDMEFYKNEILFMSTNKFDITYSILQNLFYPKDDKILNIHMAKEAYLIHPNVAKNILNNINGIVGCYFKI